jgi:hypothetical protein
MSRRNKILTALALTLLVLLLVASALLHVPQYEQRSPVEPAYSESLPADAPWLPLFDGESLAGWTPKIVGQELGVNYLDTFRVENGAISVNYSDYETFDNQFGHLFYRTPYSYYLLRLEYRFIGEQASDDLSMFWAWRNSGVMLHSQAPETMGLEQFFPVSVEVQLLGAKAGEHRSTANLCTPGTHVVLYQDSGMHTPHCTNSLSASYPGDQWVKLEVEVWGGEKVRHFVNGELVMEYGGLQFDSDDEDASAILALQIPDELSLSAGYISLQSESHPVQFRNIEIHPLEQ